MRFQRRILLFFLVPLSLVFFPLADDALIHMHNTKWMLFPLSRSNCVNTIHLFSGTSSTRQSSDRSQLIDDTSKERERGKKRKIFSFLTNEIWFRDMRTYSYSLFSVVINVVQFNSLQRFNYHANDLLYCVLFFSLLETCQ